MSKTNGRIFLDYFLSDGFVATKTYDEELRIFLTGLDLWGIDPRLYLGVLKNPLEFPIITPTPISFP
jgi:hypothetical protein